MDNRRENVPSNHITQKRYEELVASERELQLLKGAIATLSDYDYISPLRKIFNIEAKIEAKGEEKNAV